jgi:hypothetical protein
LTHAGVRPTLMLSDAEHGLNGSLFHLKKYL